MLILLLFTSSFCNSNSGSSSSSNSYTTYTVQGDTLSLIAARYGTSVSALCSINEISNTDHIYVGQVLKIPISISSGSQSSGSSTTTTINYTKYTVQNGDTLSVIAAVYDTTVSILCSINDISSPNLNVGQVLKVPVTSSDSSFKIITMSQMNQMGWHLSEALLFDLNRCCKKFGITTPARIKHFIAQCSHESSLGVNTKEFINGEVYNNRGDIGNIYPGDGPRFKGGGYIKLFGRTNYQAFSNFIGDQFVMQGVDYVVANYPWTSASFWWFTNGMNALCDRDVSVDAITLRVNGGIEGLESRRDYYKVN